MTSPPKSARALGRFLAIPFGLWLKRLALVALVVWTLKVVLARPAFDEAATAFDRADYQTALRRSLDDLERHPSSRPAALLAARSLSQKLYAEQAEPYYSRAGGPDALPLEALRDRATGFFMSNDYDRAATACKQILDAHSDDIPTLRLLALLEYSRKNFDRGILAAERLSKIPDGRVDGLALLAMNHHEAKHPEQSIVASEALLAIDPDLKTYRAGPAIFWLDFASDLVIMQRFEEARAYLDDVTGRHFESYLLDVLGLALLKLGEEEAAETKWRESIRRDPSMLNPWLQLGRMYNGQKKFDEAAKCLERAVRIEPENIDAHYQLHTSYKFLGRVDESRFHAEEAERLRQNSPEVRGGMGST